MTAVTNKYLIEGLDRLGKDTLIDGILNRRGYHQVLHFSKPRSLVCYEPCPTGMSAAEMKAESLYRYQERSFRTMFSLLRDATYSHLICNRAHLGECVYAPLYRGYDGEYVFSIERAMGMDKNHNTRLILLLEDFASAKHFTPDGESFDDTKRQVEQDLFVTAFEKSCIPDKRMIIVTDHNTGAFKSKDEILAEALAD
jgi:hypothetical protein